MAKGRCDFAVFIALCLWNSPVHAGPPVQYERLTADELVPPGSAPNLSVIELNDSGMIAAWIGALGGKEGVAVRKDGVWSWIQAPDLLPASSYDVARFDRVELSNSGRIVGSVREQLHSEFANSALIEYRWDGAGWQPRWIVEPPASGVAFGSNNLDETVWHLGYGGCGSEPMMIDRDGEIEVFREWCDPAKFFECCYSPQLRQVFDDREFILWATEYVGVGATIDSTGEVLAEFGSEAETPQKLYANDKGQMALAEPGRLVWPYRGMPGRTPAFVINAANSAFAEPLGVNTAINNLGEVLFFAGLDSGERGLFAGPDPVADKVLLDTETILGRPIERFKLITTGSQRAAFNAQRRFVVYINHGPDPYGFDDAVYLGTLYPADVNRDGIMDYGDIGAWVNLYLEGSLRTDFNNDGLLDNGDITEFITQFLNGC